MIDQIEFLKSLINKANSGMNMDGLDTDGFNIVSTVRTVKRPSGGTGNAINRGGAALSEEELSKLEACPRCGKGKLRLRNGKFGEFTVVPSIDRCTATYV